MDAAIFRRSTNNSTPFRLFPKGALSRTRPTPQAAVTASAKRWRFTLLIPVAETFFFGTLAATLAAAALGRRHGATLQGIGLSNQKLNRWLIGLSAGATANTGFVVTAAVGIGYSDGLRWVMLPIAWLIGDIVFWLIFPQRINETGRRLGASTITELLSNDLSGWPQIAMRLTTSIIAIACLSLYLSAQWISGQKFLAGAFDVSNVAALALFAILIIAYTAIGGFRGSVYADSFQAVLRIIATIVILVVAAYFAMDNRAAFLSNIAAAGPAFLDIVPPNAIGFVAGFACAGLGFGLGQPQVVSRYLAGSSPHETQGAWWILHWFCPIHLDFHDGLRRNVEGNYARHRRSRGRLEHFFSTTCHRSAFGYHCRGYFRDYRSGFQLHSGIDLTGDRP